VIHIDGGCQRTRSGPLVLAPHYARGVAPYPLPMTAVLHVPWPRGATHRADNRAVLSARTDVAQTHEYVASTCVFRALYLSADVRDPGSTFDPACRMWP
jgi:hypothetical protein